LDIGSAEMKKMIIITGVIVYSLFAAAMIADSKEPERAVERVSAEPYVVETVKSAEKTDRYVVKIVDKKIAVEDIESGKIIRITETLASTLPDGDRKLLKKGIKVKNDKQLRSLLEDFCS
jgi:hypothetical protein